MDGSQTDRAFADAIHAVVAGLGPSHLLPGLQLRHSTPSQTAARPTSELPATSPPTNPQAAPTTTQTIGRIAPEPTASASSVPNHRERSPIKVPTPPPVRCDLVARTTSVAAKPSDRQANQSVVRVVSIRLRAPPVEIESTSSMHRGRRREIAFVIPPTLTTHQSAARLSKHLQYRVNATGSTPQSSRHARCSDLSSSTPESVPRSIRVVQSRTSQRHALKSNFRETSTSCRASFSAAPIVWKRSPHLSTRASTIDRCSTADATDLRRRSPSPTRFPHLVGQGRSTTLCHRPTTTPRTDCVRPPTLCCRPLHSSPASCLPSALPKEFVRRAVPNRSRQKHFPPHRPLPAAYRRQTPPR